MKRRNYRPAYSSGNVGGVVHWLILIALVATAYFSNNKTQNAEHTTPVSAPKVTIVPVISENQDLSDAKAEQYLDDMYANAEEAYVEDMATEQAQHNLEAEAESYLIDKRLEDYNNYLEDLANSCPYTNRDSNLRAGPGTNYPVIGFAPKDSCIPIDGRNSNGTWLVFHDDKEFGAGVDVWIAASLIEAAPQDLPAVTAQVAPAASLQEVAPANVSSPNCAGGCTEYPTWCAPPIKGNISQNTGEKIYHLPGQEYYDATNISPEYGEFWFCAEDEAVAAGWRRSKR